MPHTRRYCEKEYLANFQCDQGVKFTNVFRG